MTREPARVRPAFGYALVLLAAACWATGGLAARWLFVGPLLNVDPMDLAAARAVASFLALALWMGLFRRDALIVKVRDLGFLAVFGIVGLAMVHFAYYKAISLAGVATAILLEYLALVLVLALSVGFLGERPTWTLPAGVVLAIAGSVLVVGVFDGGGSRVDPAGTAWGLAAAAFFAAYILMGKHAVSRFSPWTLLTYGLGFASAFWFVLIGGMGRVVELVSDPMGLIGVTYIAIISTIIPFGAFLTALAHIGATSASVTSTIEPVIAGAAAWVLFGETLTFLQLIGAALVITAILLVQIPFRREDGLPPVG